MGILNRSSRRVKGLEPGSKKTKPPAGASTAGGFNHGGETVNPVMIP